jgi:uncharacterized membrane protein
MIADKTPWIGNRIDPLPLAARALMGALVGSVIARDCRDNLVVGGLIGASAAVLTAHLSYRVRTRLPWSSALGGFLEDGIVVGIAAFTQARTSRAH